MFKDFWAGFWAQTHFLQLRPLKTYINQAAGSPPDNTKEHPVSLKIGCAQSLQIHFAVNCSLQRMMNQTVFVLIVIFQSNYEKRTIFPYHP